jgi:lysozyme family protein
MQQTWPQAYQWVRASEGGNDDDPQDPGGRTSRGIIQREYTAWRELHGETSKDVWTASEEEIEAIYQTQYWLPYGDLMPRGADYQFFDINVNSGVHEAALILQRSLGVNDDGHIGLVTLAALRKADPKALIPRITQERAQFYRSLTKLFRRFGKGWISRDLQVEKNALQLLGV